MQRRVCYDRKVIGARWLTLGCALTAAAAAADCAHMPASSRSTSVHTTTYVTSNVLRADYAGSRSCAPCHAAIYESWLRSPMHQMTRSLPTEVRAPFDGGVLRVADDEATMERRGDARFMRLRPAAGKERLFRVTRVIGGRYREDFAGVDVSAAADPATNEVDGPEMVLPVSFVFSTRSFRYKGYSVLVRERPGMFVGPVWSQTCIGCHNTFPQVTMLLDDLAGSRAPAFQGSITDGLLPPARRSRARVRSDRDLVAALADELDFLGESGSALSRLSTEDALRRSIRAVGRSFDGRHLLEEGVGCEACHGGAREHVTDPSVLPSYAAQSPVLSVGHEDGAPFTRAEAVNRVCAKCHSVLFSSYSWTWEGGSRKDAIPGGSSINSGEARDFLLGSCAGEMTCADCHDPHGEDTRASLDRFATPAANSTCTKCHPGLADVERLRAHTHHEPTGSGSACLGCHMPRKNMGLAYSLTRYHRIGSPTDEARVYGDRPLECAVCHAEASPRSLLSTMSAWWGRSFDVDRVARLYEGDLDGPVMQRTLDIGKPHEQAVAIGVLGDRGSSADACSVAAQLAHPYPLVRYFAKHALEQIVRSPVEADPGASREELTRLARRWCEGSGPRP